ncbi:MAG: hypothetical protein RL097_253 [Candidatus Parcubacteria bacterium]
MSLGDLDKIPHHLKSARYHRTDFSFVYTMVNQLYNLGNIYDLYQQHRNPSD